jgi:hypothetical protein
MKAFKSFFKEVNPDIVYDPEELKKGIEVELEHTNYRAIATIIAKHHLAEDPQYYTKLKAVETKSKSEDEERRLDKACWKGKKLGTPKTKIKGGIRVNNCVDAKGEDAEDIHKPVKPGRIKDRLGKLSCTKVRSAKSKLKNKGTDYAKGLQRYLNYHC